MPFAARIAEWNDQKGSEFVVPNRGSTHAFAHIGPLQGRARLPVAGDLILYFPIVDEDECSNTPQIFYAREKMEVVRPSSRIYQAALGVGALAIAASACVGGVLAPVMPEVYFSAQRSSWVSGNDGERFTVRSTKLELTSATPAAFSR